MSIKSNFLKKWTFYNLQKSGKERRWKTRRKKQGYVRRETGDSRQDMRKEREHILEMGLGEEEGKEEMEIERKMKR